MAVAAKQQISFLQSDISTLKETVTKKEKLLRDAATALTTQKETIATLKSENTLLKADLLKAQEPTYTENKDIQLLADKVVEERHLALLKEIETSKTQLKMLQ